MKGQHEARTGWVTLQQCSAELQQQWCCHGREKNRETRPLGYNFEAIFVAVVQHIFCYKNTLHAKGGSSHTAPSWSKRIQPVGRGSKAGITGSNSLPAATSPWDLAWRWSKHCQKQQNNKVSPVLQTNQFSD